jgi:Tripartite tricarboxylate transporter TctB family
MDSRLRGNDGVGIYPARSPDESEKKSPMTEKPAPPAKRQLRSDQASGLLLMALALYVWWMNRAYPLGTLAEPGPGYVPLLLAIFMGVMGVLVALAGGKSVPLAALEWTEAKRAAALLVACVVAAFALERLGYRITMAALLVFLLGVMERRKPMMVLAVGIGFPLATHYVFARLLRVPLPVSPWGF